MSIPVTTKVHVLNKFENQKDENSKIYYNLKVVDKESYESQIIGVPKDVYDFVNEGDDVRLSGVVGGLKDKYWYFNGLA